MTLNHEKKNHISKVVELIFKGEFRGMFQKADR